MGEVINLKFLIGGNKVLEPTNWQELREVYEFGTESNQPFTAAESFTFQGDSAKAIFDHMHPNGIHEPGNMLVPLVVDLKYSQNGIDSTIVNEYVIDTHQGLTMNNTSFNGGFNPLEIVCNIRKKTDIESVLIELEGLTWGLLLEDGNVSKSDYTDVNTVVVRMYNFLEVVTMLLAIYTLQKQLRDTIDQISKDIAEATDTIGEAAATGVTAGLALVFAIAVEVVKTLVKIAAAVAIAAALVIVVLDAITMLYPPVLKNKGIYFRRAMQIICGRLGYAFESNLTFLDTVAYMPSGGHSEGKQLVKDNLPAWFGNKRGIPNSYDEGYICSEFVGMLKQLTNSVLDVVDGTIWLRHEDDVSFNLQGAYSHRIDPNYTNVTYNLPDLVHTRLLEFPTDSSELYTSEYQEGRLYELKNIVNDGNLSFTKGEYIDFGVCLGHRKTKLSIVEELVTELATLADDLNDVLGVNSSILESVLGKRTGILEVSQNNFNKAKVVVVSGGKIPKQHLKILSAKAIESNSYYNRSLKRGNGQAILLNAITVPMTKSDSEKIKGNGKFIDPFWGECTFKKVEYQFSKDTAICDIEVKKNYIASGTFKEKTYE